MQIAVVLPTEEFSRANARVRLICRPGSGYWGDDGHFTRRMGMGILGIALEIIATAFPYAFPAFTLAGALFGMGLVSRYPPAVP